MFSSCSDGLLCHVQRLESRELGIKEVLRFIKER